MNSLAPTRSADFSRALSAPSSHLKKHFCFPWLLICCPIIDWQAKECSYLTIDKGRFQLWSSLVSVEKWTEWRERTARYLKEEGDTEAGWRARTRVRNRRVRQPVFARLATHNKTRNKLTEGKRRHDKVRKRFESAPKSHVMGNEIEAGGWRKKGWNWNDAGTVTSFSRQYQQLLEIQNIDNRKRAAVFHQFPKRSGCHTKSFLPLPKLDECTMWCKWEFYLIDQCANAPLGPDMRFCALSVP